MANPPVTIGPFANVPAPGSPIRSDWPQQISTHVTDLEFRRWAVGSFVPAGNLDTAGSTTPTLWCGYTFPAGPSWANFARVSVTIDGIFPVGTLTSFNIGLRAGPIPSRPILAHLPDMRIPPFTVTQAGSITPGAVLPAEVWANQVSGTAILRADGASTFRFTVDYLTQ